MKLLKVVNINTKLTSELMIRIKRIIESTENITIMGLLHWWIVELPMRFVDGFLATFFGTWKGAIN